METQVDPPFNSTSFHHSIQHNEEVMNADIEKSTSLAESSGYLNSDSVNAVFSDHISEEEEDGGDYGSDYDDNDDYISADDDDYLSMQAQLDSLHLPAGVEASVSWLKGPSPSSSIPSAESTSAPSNAASLSTEAHASNSIVLHNEAQVMQRFEQFKKFDVVEAFPDHQYISEGFLKKQPPKNWTKKVQDEWKILENDLPDTIYVRVCETRMDLLRAVIVGPAGTPYHDGLFTFDVLFPPTYPSVPPMVHYYAGGLRLNPNLYNCGKVCLSLLGTWSGKETETWMPNQSTMLQVLVSIQALILNSNPFFNEPGYDSLYRGDEGERKSRSYNEEVFILSLKTMTYTLRRPPKHFEDLVAGHFRTRAHAILFACKTYMEGAQVGSAANVSEPDYSNSCSKEFRDAVGIMLNGLVTLFSRYAAVDCSEFRIAS